MLVFFQTRLKKSLIQQKSAITQESNLQILNRGVLKYLLKKWKFSILETTVTPSWKFIHGTFNRRVHNTPLVFPATNLAALMQNLDKYFFCGALLKLFFKLFFFKHLLYPYSQAWSPMSCETKNKLSVSSRVIN